MGLKEYRAKRDFKKTIEPRRGGKGKQLFVVQKHYATHLHYDFRIEYKGVLLSWAVPKGPSRTAGVKRLAVQVEDHPLNYADFEGVIPKGNYGAGKVEIWDRGTYTASHLKAGLKKGHLAIELKGKKLKGTYDLIQLKGKPKMWLLIRRKS
ncbi:MAG: 3'-phosphoesterase [Verrucomicrobiota bacterium]|nr:3'-phosphoesterase [Verrucomicrobiota bacterium]